MIAAHPLGAQAPVRAHDLRHRHRDRRRRPDRRDAPDHSRYRRQEHGPDHRRGRLIPRRRLRPAQPPGACRQAAAESRLYRREAEALIRRTREDARAAPGLAAVADVKAGNRTFLSATVNGSTPEIQSIRNIVLSSGRFFTEAESRRSAPVIIIGQDLVDELFPTRDPIGRSLRIRGRALEVIGVQQSLGTSFGSPLDRVAYMPLGTFEKIWGSRRSVTVYLQPLPHLPLEESLERSRVALRLLRRLRPAEPDDFDILVPEADRDFLLRVIGIVGVAVVPISSLALLVAGIVVMNMMLVSVTERTREIGVRKAVGASNRDIFAESCSNRPSSPPSAAPRGLPSPSSGLSDWGGRSARVCPFPAPTLPWRWGSRP